MIDKKQKLTPDILLSFKKDHGEFYQKFVNSVKGKLHFYRRVRENRQCPSYMTPELLMFLCILQKKHQKFQNQEFDLVQFGKILEKYRPRIVKSISEQKNCPLKGIKPQKVELIENSITETVTRQYFAFNTFRVPQLIYIYELFKAITGKKEDVGMFGDHKYNGFTYTESVIQKINQTFEEKIAFLDYNSNKNIHDNLKFNYKTTYILRIKEKYAILYVKQPKDMQILNEGQISLKLVESIFCQKTQTKAQSNYFGGLLNNLVSGNDQNKAKPQSKLFPDDITCSKCQQQMSEFDALKWNYEWFCGSCLQNPKINTSDIPPSLIEKYFQQKGIRHDNYELQCFECKGQTHLKHYNPAYKPRHYECEICEHKVCLEHYCNIYECFCQCAKCRLPTISLGELNLVICEICKNKRCFKCNTTSEKQCKCICPKCSELMEEGHQCREACHYCHNKINRLKDCPCGKKLCYGCYYFKLETSKDQKVACKG